MLSDKARPALFDIRDNGFAHVLCSDTGSRDHFRGRATLPPELRERRSELPWRAIMGVGNVYRHNYDNVAEEYVWRALHESLPALLTVVAQEIEQLSESPRSAAQGRPG